jgi:manganese/iron transport system ATP-binding protein
MEKDMSVRPSMHPPSPSEESVCVHGVWAGYNGRPALEDIDLCLSRGNMVGLVGPNGSGKSTLIKVVLGLVRPWRGEVTVFGRPVDRMRTRVAYTPQAELVDWQFPVTVAEVVMMGRYGRLGPLRRPRRQDRLAVEQSLERVGIEGLADRQIGELSGGQQQRMLVARALAQEPEVLLLDEPMVALDATSQHELLTLFEELREQGKTLLVATHDLTCVAESFDAGLLLNRRVVAYGPPTEIFTEERLNEAYGSHMMLLPMGERLYGVHHRYG